MLYNMRDKITDEMIIYSKRHGEPPIPLTVRIDWLPDGTIKPTMYWTPDGSIYEVKHIYECTKMAYLKDRGVGIRFKIRAEVIEAPEPCYDQRYTSHDTYLYFANSLFCGRNIVDSRYGHPGKEFIHVTLDVFPDCNYEIAYFRVKDQRYKVECPHVAEPRGSYSAGGIGICHKVDARLVNEDDDEDPEPNNSIRRMAALFLEIDKWFVRCA